MFLPELKLFNSALTGKVILYKITFEFMLKIFTITFLELLEKRA